MKRWFLAGVCSLMLLGGAPLNAVTHRGSGGKTTHAPKTPKAPKAPKAKKARTAKAKTPSAQKCQTCARDEKNRIKRSEAAKRTFMKDTGYPKGRKGYVVDHVIPLACGGADAPSNMQWETVAEAAAKDKIERAGCTR